MFTAIFGWPWRLRVFAANLERESTSAISNAARLSSFHSIIRNFESVAGSFAHGRGARTRALPGLITEM
jgi:hypothetical protein